MSRRRIVDNIVEWKKRLSFYRFYSDSKIDELKKEWYKIGDASVFADFIPIRLATIIEVHTRQSVREVIDSAEIYLDRAEPLLRDVKLSFLIAKHLHGQRITMGDIVAHSISVSGLDHVLSIYETLFPSYRSALPLVHERWIEDQDEGQYRPIIGDVDRVLAGVKRVFEIRHILVHEITQKIPYSREEIPELLKSTQDFLAATDWFLTGELFGDVPRSQSMMTQLAYEDLQRETEAMEVLLTEIRAKGGVDVERLQSSQEMWDSYANAPANFVASEMAGGSAEPMLWAGSKAALTRARTKELRRWVEQPE